jgi:hypothetical protein
LAVLEQQRGNAREEVGELTLGDRLELVERDLERVSCAVPLERLAGVRVDPVHRALLTDAQHLDQVRLVAHRIAARRRTATLRILRNGCAVR